MQHPRPRSRRRSRTICHVVREAGAFNFLDFVGIWSRAVLAGWRLGHFLLLRADRLQVLVAAFCSVAEPLLEAVLHIAAFHSFDERNFGHLVNVQTVRR